MKFNCWICEGWEERTFTWYPGKSGMFDVDEKFNPIFVHFENEGWKAIPLEPYRYTIDEPRRVKKTKIDTPKEDDVSAIVSPKTPSKWGGLKA